MEMGSRAMLSLKYCIWPWLQQNDFFTSQSPRSRASAFPSCKETGSSAHPFCSCTGVTVMRRMLCSLDCYWSENWYSHPPQCKLEQPQGCCSRDAALSPCCCPELGTHGILVLQTCKWHLWDLSDLTFCTCRAKLCFAEHRFCNGPQ